MSVGAAFLNGTPKHEEHADMLEWLGIETADEFDPEAFDPVEVNLVLGGRTGVA